ncbi:MAG: 1-deoxy-D-xylulose-5-phosphate synthase [Propionibacteriaceae bacterium]|jgi:1-deoxy-D-xylulose-5-phosphate synthase|nr:1-deoxy-D-xylulose-5-phosphate synthase [Propionibacteriaceae bacterium]
MEWLNGITSPLDLRDLTDEQLDEFAAEIRAFLIDHVAATGGHLGPNLGVVELTLAIHRIFESPDDPIIFDTGHQSYVHKILTGRHESFATLRQADGLSGYPSREESEHDWNSNSHASTALSWGAGIAEAFRLQNNPHDVVVVVGDGALTGGLAWEALNNIAVQRDLRLIIVVNDNEHSYTRTVGALAEQLDGLRTDRRYEQFLDVLKRVVQGTPLVGGAAYELLHGLKIGLKDVLAPQGLFADLGLKYIGPIDGHDRAAVERGLTQAKGFGGPVIVHCLTHKGHGYKAAEENVADHFHTIGRFDALTGAPLPGEGPSLTDVFAEEICQLAEERPDLVALSAAMVNPVGLGPFAERFPTRLFDVGIAEQHAVASAAGLAIAGCHPVIAVYATFLNRGFDQVLMDVGLHRLGVTFVLDRAGVTGPDGPSHHGMWDMALLTMVPGLRLAAPRDAARLRAALGDAVAVDDRPTVIRFPKGAAPAPLEAIRQEGGVDILAEAGPRCEVLIIGYGPMAAVAVDAAHRLAEAGVTARAIDPLWAWPINPTVFDLAGEARLVVSVEDGVDTGGLGEKLGAALADRGLTTPVARHAIPDRFIPQGSRGAILDDLGLSAEAVVATVLARIGQASDISSEHGAEDSHPGD